MKPLYQNLLSTSYWDKENEQIQLARHRLFDAYKEVASNSAFIVGDTIDERVGYKIENITTVHDHVAGKKGSKYLWRQNSVGFA